MLRAHLDPNQDQWLKGYDAQIDLATLTRSTALDCDRELLRGKSALLAVGSQTHAALALLELDGLARRIVLCPPGLDPAHLPQIIADAEIDALVCDTAPMETPLAAVPARAICSTQLRPAPAPAREPACRTEWVLLTSGTTGAPKLVVHTLESLAGALRPAEPGSPRPIWSTFYDIRRYGGLQILLRAIITGGSLVLSSAAESAGTFLRRAAQNGVTHISGTPSHWRRALMTPDAHAITPAYVRMSGEIADQLIINNLQATYPAARVAHAFASTEAGLAFEVNDRLAGFPAALLETPGPVELRIVADTLRIRSPRTALRYLGAVPPLRDAEGWVDTGDVVQRSGERYLFLGRHNGVINVGGQKVYPEEIEAALNQHPSVRASLVRARKNPITGAVVTADIVLSDAAAGGDEVLLKQEIITACRGRLAPYKVPAVLRIVPTLAITDSGKLGRNHA